MIVKYILFLLILLNIGYAYEADCTAKLNVNANSNDIVFHIQVKNRTLTTYQTWGNFTSYYSNRDSDGGYCYSGQYDSYSCLGKFNNGLFSFTSLGESASIKGSCTIR